MTTVRSASPTPGLPSGAAGDAARGRLLGWIVLLAAVLAAGWFQVHNLDIGLHARTGQWIVEHGRVPAVNVLSRLHADHPTVDDKWLFQVAAHLLFDGLGPDACIIARELLLLALFGIMAVTARRLGAGTWSTAGWLLLALVAGRSRFTFRPDLVSSVLTVAVVHVLLVSARDGRGAWVLVPLQLLWVNVHGYFITGPLMLFAVAGAQALCGAGGRAVARRLLPVGALMLAACLVNPAGLDGALHPVSILRDLRAHQDFYRSAIIEFRPTLAPDPRQPWDRLAYATLGVPALLLLAGAALQTWRGRGEGAAHAAHPAQPAQPAPVAQARNAAPRRDDRGAALSALALCVLFGVMSFELRRNMAPFAFVVAPLAAAAWSLRLARASRSRGAALGLRGAAPAFVTLLALLVAWGELSDATSIHDGLDRRAGFGLSRIAYPDAGIEFIARELPEASVFTAFSYGSTFTGRRWPQQVASTDGNTHGYPTAYLQEVLAASASDDAASFLALSARDGHDVALIPMAGPLSIALLQEPAWALACVGVREAVWVRRAAMEPGWLAAHDLLAQWRAGRRPALPDTPVEPPYAWLPFVRRAHWPLAEVDQATLLSAAGLVEQALARATEATLRAPGCAEALSLRGLLCARLGRDDEARELLEAALHAPGYNRLADAAATVLGRL
jgi:hypothetical protein